MTKSRKTTKANGRKKRRSHKMLGATMLRAVNLIKRMERGARKQKKRRANHLQGKRKYWL